MTLSSKEQKILRELAQKYMEIAVLPVQREKKALWQALNRLQMQRPMLNMDQIPWHEMDVDGSLVNQVEDPYWRNVETTLRRTIYRFEHMPVDMVVEPYITLYRPIVYDPYGMQIHVDTIRLDQKNDVAAQHFTNLLETEEDLEKIKTPTATLLAEDEKRIIQEAEVLFHGIAPFHMAGMTMHLGIWDPITQWMGVENCYIELMDRPAFMHAIMERATSGMESLIDNMNRQGLFDVYTNVCHCSYTYLDELPTPGCDPDRPQSKDVWAFGLAQLFSSVSPDITAEFEVPYMKRIFSKFGAIYYGCCEKLDDRLDIIAQMPNIHKVSCSPWSNREHFAATLPKQYIMSNKPNPALVGASVMDEEEVRKDIRRTIDAAKRNQVNLELILKDISTVQYEPQRLWNWSRIALEEVCR